MELSVKYLSIGTMLTFKGKPYEIVKHFIEIDDSDISCLSVLQPVDDNGEDLEEDTISVNLDMYDYTVH